MFSTPDLYKCKDMKQLNHHNLVQPKFNIQRQSVNHFLNESNIVQFITRFNHLQQKKLKELREAITLENSEKGVDLIRMFKENKCEDKLKGGIDDDENSFLHFVCKNNQHRILQALLEAGLNPNVKNCVSL